MCETEIKIAYIKKHVYKDRKETTHVEIGERTVITTSSYIYNIISTRFAVTKYEHCI